VAKAASSRPADMQAPTMVDVANRAGVSAMTVSRALKDGGRVSRATREKIMTAVNDLGYVLDQSAGSLSSRKTGFVAAMVPSINNSNFADTARGITDELESTGLQLLLGYTDYTVEKEEKLIEAMLRRRPEGIILTGGAHTERARRLLKNAGIPVVETWELGMAAQRFRDRSRSAANFTPLGGDASRPRMDDRASQVRHACTRFRGERGRDDRPHNTLGLCAWAVSKGPAAAVHRREVGGRGRIKPIGSDSPGCRRDRAYIILATPGARLPSCVLRLGGECRDRHGGAWHTSLPHCTWSPCCPLPDRK
jgi:hypothetical protein